MTEFKADCTINIHVEARGKSGNFIWACSIVHYKRGRLVTAKKFAGSRPREEVELEAIYFGLRQTARLLQEKVELNATFSLEDRLHVGRKKLDPAIKETREKVAKAWDGFRLKRVSRMAGEEAKILREAVDSASERKVP